MTEPTTEAIGPRERIPQADHLSVGETVLVRVQRGEDEDDAILFRTEEGFVAYLNRCRHLAIPLDYGDGEVLDESGALFQCRTHGALFRPKDGFCVAGPCSGEYLVPVSIEEREDGVYLAGEEAR